jgi:hypothetical protein
LQRTAARPAAQARAAGVDGESVLAIVRAALLQSAGGPDGQPDLTPPG